MARVCVRHPFEHSENLCGMCGLEFCRDCLVYPAGRRKLPFCVSCALTAGGVRANARNQTGLSQREIKRRLRERRQEDRQLARHQRGPVELPPIANPIAPGWAVSDGDAPPEPEPLEHVDVDALEAVNLTALSEPAAHAAPAAPEPVAATARPDPATPKTLADLLPDDPDGDDDDAPRRRAITLPVLRRRREEPDTDAAETSQMIAWLDEVFAPRPPDDGR